MRTIKSPVRRTAPSPRRSVPLSIALVLACGSAASAQTSLTGSSLVLKSRGAASGTTLSTTGYLGTFLTVPSGGATVNFNVNATGSGGHMNLVIADSKFGFNVAGGAAANYATQNVALPAGTYLVRAERDYNNGANSSFSVNNLSVNTVSGSAAQFSNVANSGATAAQASANAVAAANTYINNYRKGSWDLNVQGVLPGTAVQVKLNNSAFKFGTAVPDSLSTYLSANPAAGSTAQKYQQRLLENFSSITPENGGKWSGSDTALQLKATDRMIRFAEVNGMRVRQHNLIWSTQQPTAVNTAFINAQSTDPTTAAAGKAAIQQAVTNRIGSYVSGTNSETGINGIPATPRAKGYADLDVYNESYHTGAIAASNLNDNYWKVLGASAADGPAVTADFYNRVRTAVVNSGANTRLFVNEYNVLNNDPDQYAQWYSQHTESIRKTRGRVDGIGVQYYTDAGVTVGGGNADAFRGYTSLANLATQGLPMELTEFGTTAGTNAAASLTQAMTVAFGTPDMTGFTLWGMYDTGAGMYAGARGSVLYDQSFNLTAAGTAYQALRAQWTTDVSTTINADGSITLPSGAFYGDYDIVIKGQHYGVTFDKATNRYLLAVLKGDVNNDELVNAADIDTLFAATAGTVPAAAIRFDLNSDGTVNNAPNVAGSDVDYLVRVIKGTEYGDANLDGKVDFNDLVTLAQHYNEVGGATWANASFNGDGNVNFDDLVVLAQHYNFGASGLVTDPTFASDWALAQSLAPEPTTFLTPALIALAWLRRRRGDMS